MKGIERSRLDALFDGVFAIALTLLVLELKVPERLTSAELPAYLGELMPKLFIYALAFLYLGTAWLYHFYFGILVARTNFWNTILNLLQLVFIGIFPFSAALLGSYIDSPFALATFTLSLFGYAVLGTINVWYSLMSPDITAPSVDPLLIRDIMLSCLVSAVFWLAVTGLSFLAHRLALTLTSVMLFVNTIYLWTLQPRIFQARALQTGASQG